MNYAYVDASWQEQPEGYGLGGWGLVLLLPGQWPAWLQGRLDAPDNNAAELRAVLEALRVAPSGQALAVYTDNQAVVAAVARGRGPQLLTEMTREIHTEAQAKGVTLQAQYVPRTGRHMLTAHELANEARRGTASTGLAIGGLTVTGLAPTALLLSHTDVLLEARPALGEARVTLRRRSAGGQAERVTARVRLDSASEVPPSVQLLLAALKLAQPGELLSVRRASRVAQALWQKPERALRPAVSDWLQQARENAAGQGVTVQFLGTD